MLQKKRQKKRSMEELVFKAPKTKSRRSFSSSVNGIPTTVKNTFWTFIF
jgi:hypothetical protein